MAPSVSSSTPHEHPPTSGAWMPGDPVGRRLFAELFATEPLALDAGGELGDHPLTVAFETWGTLNRARDNAVLVLHALTGDSHAAGPPGDGHPTPGWWDALIGPGRALDTDRFFIVSPNVLGGCQGTTGPSSHAPDANPWGSRFPRITIRDQVRVEQALLDALGVDRLFGVVGGSMGGMRALEWAVSAPQRVERLVVLACGTHATAEQIALSYVQSEAIRLDPGFAGGDYYDAKPHAGPWRGLGVARRIGQISYRTRHELIDRFGHQPQEHEDPFRGGRFAVEGYLDHQAEKLAWRFDANSYLVLSRAMDLHDVGRDRGGIGSALQAIRASTMVLGFDSDRLYPVEEQAVLAAEIAHAEDLVVLPSRFGHDAFLLETAQIEPHLRRALA